MITIPMITTPCHIGVSGVPSQQHRILFRHPAPSESGVSPTSIDQRPTAWTTPTDTVGMISPYNPALSPSLAYPSRVVYCMGLFGGLFPPFHHYEYVHCYCSASTTVRRRRSINVRRLYCRDGQRIMASAVLVSFPFRPFRCSYSRHSLRPTRFWNTRSIGRHH